MDRSILTSSPIFRGFDGVRIEEILSNINHQVKKYNPGTVVAISGEQVQSLRIVISGVVKGEMTDSSGRVLKIENIPAPGALAPAFLFGAANTFPVDVVALEPSELLIIEKGEFIRMLSLYPNLLENYLDMICSRSQFLSEKIRFFTFKTIRARIADYLLGVSASGKDNIKLKITQHEMSELFGVARPSVARAMKELEDAGIIKADRKDIMILDREGLINIARD